MIQSNPWSNLEQEIQFWEFMGGSNLGKRLIGASMSEPHTSESNCQFFMYDIVYIYVYIYLSYIVP